MKNSFLVLPIIVSLTGELIKNTEYDDYYVIKSHTHEESKLDLNLLNRKVHNYDMDSTSNRYTDIEFLV